MQRNAPLCWRGQVEKLLRIRLHISRFLWRFAVISHFWRHPFLYTCARAKAQEHQDARRQTFGHLRPEAHAAHVILWLWAHVCARRPLCDRALRTCGLGLDDASRLDAPTQRFARSPARPSKELRLCCEEVGSRRVASANATAGSCKGSVLQCVLEPRIASRRSARIRDDACGASSPT